MKIDRISDTGVAADGAFLLHVVGIKPEFLWYVSECVNPNTNYTATLKVLLTNIFAHIILFYALFKDASLAVTISNVTVCEDPIANLTVTFVPAETIQKVEWEPEICLKSTEEVTINIETLKGFPITYNISFGDGSVVVAEEIITAPGKLSSNNESLIRLFSLS